MASVCTQKLLNRFSRLLVAKPSSISHRIPSNSGCLGVHVNSELAGMPAVLGICNIHTGAVRDAWFKKGGPQKWTEFNKKVYPPQDPSEERRPAFVCHSRANIKYPPKKLWYVACMVRGMTIDEAVKQLGFVLKKGAEPVKETLLEAQEMAVRDHNVEFKSNLWVAESYVGRGQVIKGMRRHARKRVGMIEYKHSHYFVRLEEGKPPAHYYEPPKTGEEMLDQWMTKMRQRRIISSL